jgi:hypothetical protein
MHFSLEKHFSRFNVWRRRRRRRRRRTTISLRNAVQKRPTLGFEFCDHSPLYVIRNSKMPFAQLHCNRPLPPPPHPTCVHTTWRSFLPFRFSSLGSTTHDNCLYGWRIPFAVSQSTHPPAHAASITPHSSSSNQPTPPSFFGSSLCCFLSVFLVPCVQFSAALLPF